MSEAEQPPQDVEFTSIPYGSYVQIDTVPCCPSSEVSQSGEAPSSSLSRKPVKYVMNSQSFLCRKLPSGEVCILTEEEIDRVQKTDQCGHIDRLSLDESAEYLEVTPEEVLKANFMARDKIKELEQKLTETTIRDVLDDNPKSINTLPPQLNRSGSTSSGYSEGMSFSPLTPKKGGQISESLSHEGLRGTMESLRTELKKKEESIEILKSICESCCSNEQELKSTLNKACETVQSLDTQLEGEAFERFKVQSEFDKHKAMTSSLLEDLKASKDKIAQKEKEKEKLKCSYESELARTTREKANTEVQLHHLKTDSQLLQSELARAEGRTKEFETKWREAAAEAKGYRRRLDENYAKVLQLEPENGQLKEKVRELESILQAMPNFENEFKDPKASKYQIAQKEKEKERVLKEREFSELKLKKQTEELRRDLEKRVDSELKLKKQTEELREEIQVRMDYERQLKMQTAEITRVLKEREFSELKLKKQTEELRRDLEKRVDSELKLKKQTEELRRKLEDVDKNRMEAERELKRQTEKLKEALEAREMWEKQIASLRDENTTLQDALDHDPQSKLLHKLHENLQVVRTGVQDISEEVKQICDPTSRISELENESMALKLKQKEKETELKKVTDQLAMTVHWQSKRKEEDRSLIEQVIREQQMTIRKEVLSHLKLHSQTLLGTQKKDEVLDEKLLGQVEDLQKQLKEKTEDLSKVSTELSEMSHKRDSLERELKDALSVERETQDLQREVEQLKLQTKNASRKLTQSKECIKALENMLNNLVLWEKTTDVEQLRSDVGSVSVRKPIVLGPLAYETELEKFCWIPFGVQSLSVGQEGGLFSLQPQSKGLSEDRDVIMLEVPKNAVNTAVCDKLCIRYGVIVYGPFDVPEGYQLGSMAVYIYFDGDHTVKPVLLHLPHWSGKDSESNLKCAIAPHRLEEGEEKYQFRFTEDGDFESTDGSCVITIDGHCSLFALLIKALQQKSSLRYYASRVEKVGDYSTSLDVVITHASQVWLEILNEDKTRGTIHPAVLFTFDEGMLQGSMSSQEGKGWKAMLNEHDMVHQRDVEHESHGIEHAHDMKGAVERRVYPPYISCQTTYSEEVRKTGEPVKVKLVIKGAKDRDYWSFPCTAFEYSSERQGPIGESISLATQSSVQPTLNGSPHSPTSPTLSLNTLTEHVVRHVAADWYQLGLFLGVEARVLDTVKTNYSKDATEACTAMLGKWLDGAPGTGEKKKEWGTLLEAIGEAIGSEILKTIQKNLNLTSSVTCTQSLQDAELGYMPEVSQDTS